MGTRFYERQDFFLHPLRIEARHGVVFQAAFAALAVSAAVADGDGKHCGYLVLGDQVVQYRKQQSVGTVSAEDKGRGCAGHVLFRNIDRDVANIRSGMAGGYDELRGVCGVGFAKGAGVACDAGVDLAVG